MQSTPDFSGRWVLVASEQPGPETPRALSVRQSVERTNVRGDPMPPLFKSITVEREFPSTTRSETHQIGLMGGFVSGVIGTENPSGSRTTHAVRLDGDALVFESGTYSTGPGTPGAWSERREAWSLDAEGRLRVTTTTRGSADVSGTTVTVTYRRP